MIVNKMEPDDKNTDFVASEPNISSGTRKELPWFVCASITTCLVVFCYEYSESLEPLTDKREDYNKNIPLKNEKEDIGDEKLPAQDTDHSGRLVFNVITIIICFLAILATWNTPNKKVKSTKSPEPAEKKQAQ